jgi:hypothetical protein
MQKEIDDCVAAAAQLRQKHAAGEALRRWMLRFTDLVATKQGLAGALQSNGRAFEELAENFTNRVTPVVADMLEAAQVSGEVRADVSAEQLLRAAVHLCLPVPGEGPAHNQRMVAIFMDGLAR